MKTLTVKKMGTLFLFFCNLFQSSCLYPQGLENQGREAFYESPSKNFLEDIKLSRSQNYLIEAEARNYSRQCENSSKRILEAKIIYHNTQISSQAIVTLIRGFSGFDEIIDHDQVKKVNFNWANQMEQKLLVLGNETWQANVSDFASFTEVSRQLNGLDFVFKISLPDGQAYYDDGFATDAWGFSYQTKIRGSYHLEIPPFMGCFNSSAKGPNFEAIDINAVQDIAPVL